MNAQRGFSLIEVLVTIVILAFGLLGLAGLQARMMTLEMESYQRSQALLLLSDMMSRLEARVAVNGADYLTAASYPDGIGSGDDQPASCAGEAVGSARDLCEWSNMLKGAAETAASGKVGAMIGARGCITQIQAQDPTAGVCAPGIYEVSVAWQGIVGTVVPGNTCGQGEYGADETLRRVVSGRVTAATVGCVL